MADSTSKPVKAFVSFAEATDHLEGLCQEMGVRHLSYWCVSYADDSPDQVTWIATYDPAYMNHYMSSYTPLGDPVFEMKIDFVDWAQVNADDPSAQVMQDQAAKYGIARNGLSYRFKDAPDLRILFSVNVDCADADWPWRREALLEPIRALAHEIHRRAKPLVESRRMAA